jgi:uncharacterized protein (TIGR02147 family)
MERRFERLQAIKGIKFRTVADGAVDFFRDWYHMAVRSLISIYPFDGKEYRKLGSMLTPAITARQARESIQLLDSLGLIARDKSGVYRVTGQFISTGEKWMSPVIRDYQKKTMELAQASLEVHRKDLRDISTVTMTFSTKQLPALRERIRAFRQELLLMSQDIKDEDCVMQLNIQFFPTAMIDREDA